MSAENIYTPANYQVPDVYIDFDSSNCDCKIIGCPSFTESFDGSKAIHLSNQFGKKATQYIQLDNCLPEGSFSISFWYKASACGGCGQYPPKAPKEYLGMDNFLIRAGGTIFANTSAGKEIATGFTAMNLPATISAKFSVCDGTTSFRSNTSLPISVIQDMRWHYIVFSFFKDEKKADIYIDATRVCSIDFSEAESFENNRTLCIGADTFGEYGIESGLFDCIAIYNSPLSDNNMKNIFSKQNLLKEIQTVKNILNTSKVGERFSSDHLDELKEALLYAQNHTKDNPELVRNDLRKALNKFLMGNPPLHKVIIASDSHLVTDNENNPACKNLINLLNSNKSLEFNATTLINAGDHCNTRERENHDHYFNLIDKYFRSGNTTEVTCIGNHQYTHYALPGVDMFKPLDISHFRNRISERTNLRFPPNEQLVDKDGILIKEYYYTTDGYIHYITLNPWENCGWKLVANITEEQCDWLENTLEFCNDGKPIFVVCHYPLNELSMKHNSCGYNSRARINKLFSKYKNVILVRGHSHNGLGKSGVTYRENYTEIDCPTLLGARCRDGFYDSSAFFAFIYKNSIVLRAFNCRTESWLPEYDSVIDLNYKHTKQIEKATIERKVSVSGTTVKNGFNKATMTYYRFAAEGTNTGITADVYKQILNDNNEAVADFWDSAVCYNPANNYEFDLYDSLNYLELPAYRNSLILGDIPFNGESLKTSDYFFCTGPQGNGSIISAINADKAIFGSQEFPIAVIKADLHKKTAIKGFLISNGKGTENWNSRGYSIYISDTQFDLFEEYNKVLTFDSADGLLNITEQYYCQDTHYGYAFSKDPNNGTPITFANVQHFSFTSELPTGRYVGLKIFDGGTRDNPRCDILQFRIFTD